MFSGDADNAPDGTPRGIKAWALLLAVFTAEQSYLVMRWAVCAVISKLESPERTADRRRTDLLRRRFLEESLKGLPSPTTRVRLEESGKVDRESLEEQAKGQVPESDEQRFWARQHDWTEVCKAGDNIIERFADDGESKKEK
jgi:anoctamin-10